MNHDIPFLVAMDLATPLLVDVNATHRSLCLDALLAGVLVARGLDPEALPLAQCEGVWCASQMIPCQSEVLDGITERMVRIRRSGACFQSEEWLRVPHRGGEYKGYGYSASVGRSAGQIKPLRNAYVRLPASTTLSWAGRGDPDAVQAILAWICAPDGTPGYGMGRSASAGFGQVRRIRVRERDYDISLAAQGQPMRPIPMDAWQRMGHGTAGVTTASVAWRYPYFSTPKTLCAVPAWRSISRSVYSRFVTESNA